MIQLRRILCPIDLSPISGHALDHAAALAHRYAATLTLLHIRDVARPALLPAAASGAARTGLAAMAAHVEPAASVQLRELMRPALRSGVSVDFVEDEGDPAACIVERARESDLVVMATHGREGLKRFMLGSVASRVLHDVDRPLLTVPPPCHKPPAAPFSRIVCAVDFSEVSLFALEYALSLALEMRAYLTLLHVAEAEVAEDLGGPRPFSAPEQALDRLHQLHKRLAALVPEQARDRSAPETQVREGRPEAAILAAAADLDVNLIVMGARARRVLGALLGSTTDSVVRHATCPVLTVGHPHPRRTG